MKKVILILLLLLLLPILISCRCIPQPKMNQAIEFYDKNVKNFPNTNP